MADWTQWNFEDCAMTSKRRPGIIERVDKSMNLVENQPSTQEPNKPVATKQVAPELCETKTQDVSTQSIVRRKGFVERVDELMNE